MAETASHLSPSIPVSEETSAVVIIIIVIVKYKHNK